ncbi:hypothetical protein B0H16DRAFT_1763793 [Mycena metata]|uniref:Uncharacterized protein n=1 Tax=Mycena metata TaxID=1033252 RepID=A0AAD7MX95_9AGAR|nr:hypothetical protein B0H16DRAFT_1763793 [Mycena metata]
MYGGDTDSGEMRGEEKERCGNEGLDAMESTWIVATDSERRGGGGSGPSGRQALTGKAYTKKRDAQKAVIGRMADKSARRAKPGRRVREEVNARATEAVTTPALQWRPNSRRWWARRVKLARVKCRNAGHARRAYRIGKAGARTQRRGARMEPPASCASKREAPHPKKRIARKNVKTAVIAHRNAKPDISAARWKASAAHGENAQGGHRVPAHPFFRSSRPPRFQAQKERRRNSPDLARIVGECPHAVVPIDVPVGKDMRYDSGDAKDAHRAAVDGDDEWRDDVPFNEIFTSLRRKAVEAVIPARIASWRFSSLSSWRSVATEGRDGAQRSGTAISRAKHPPNASKNARARIMHQDEGAGGRLNAKPRPRKRHRETAPAREESRDAKFEPETRPAPARMPLECDPEEVEGTHD